MVIEKAEIKKYIVKQSIRLLMKVHVMYVMYIAQPQTGNVLT